MQIDYREKHIEARKKLVWLLADKDFGASYTLETTSFSKVNGFPLDVFILAAPRLDDGSERTKGAMAAEPALKVLSPTKFDVPRNFRDRLDGIEATNERFSHIITSCCDS